jgi:hypothetical protein
MGVIGGAWLAEDLWETVRKHLSKKKRQEIAQRWVEIFEARGWDMIGTIVGDDSGVVHDDERGSYFPWQK